MNVFLSEANVHFRTALAYSPTPMKRDADANGSSPRPLQHFAGRVAVACGVIVTFVLCWHLRGVLLLGFGGIVLAVIIRALAQPLIRRAHFRERWAIATVVIALVAMGVGMSWLFGSQVTAQIRGLEERLPRAIEPVLPWSESKVWNRAVRGQSIPRNPGNTGLPRRIKPDGISSAEVE